MAGKNLPQTGPEMFEAELSRKGNRMYKQESAEFVDGQLTALVDDMADQLEKASSMEPVALTDTERVKSITMKYLRACSTASTLPSMTGLSRSLGMTRQALYDCIARHSPRATAEWLTLCREGFAELLETGSLRNSTNPVVSIFLLKASYGYRESAEFIIGGKEQLTAEDQEQIAAEIMSRYSDLIED